VDVRANVSRKERNYGDDVYELEVFPKPDETF